MLQPAVPIPPHQFGVKLPADMAEVFNDVLGFGPSNVVDTADPRGEARWVKRKLSRLKGTHYFEGDGPDAARWLFNLIAELSGTEVYRYAHYEVMDVARQDGRTIRIWRVAKKGYGLSFAEVEPGTPKMGQAEKRRRL